MSRESRLVLQLASVVRRGKPATRRPSVRGAGGDLASFIRAMHEVSEPMAMPLISSLGPKLGNVSNLYLEQDAEDHPPQLGDVGLRQKTALAEVSQPP